MHNQIPVDFANGLAGLGWGFEYLVKTGFVEANTAEALQEIDTVIFHRNKDKMIYLKSQSICLELGVIPDLVKLKKIPTNRPTAIFMQWGDLNLP